MKVVGVGAVVLALAAGCGESDSADRLSKEEYIRQADAICADFEQRLDKLPDPKTIQDVVALADDAKPIAEKGISRLRALRPPEELEADVERWLELNEENVDAIEQLRTAAEAGDEERAQAISAAATKNEQRADELGAKIGFESCASDGG